MAGQSVGLVSREQSTAAIFDELIDQALAVIAGRERRRGGTIAGLANRQGRRNAAI